MNGNNRMMKTTFCFLCPGGLIFRETMSRITMEVLAWGGAKEVVEPAKPTMLAGVLLVIKVDNIPSNILALALNLKGLLENEGLHPLPPSTVVNLTPLGGASLGLFLVMEEGYENAHHYPARLHFGLDIVLWSKISKLDDLRVSLLLGMLGAKLLDHSSYCVIHGGMLGAKNWREDVNAVVPVNRNLRQCAPEVAAGEPKAGPGLMDDGVFAAAVMASLSMLPKKMDEVITVLCGTEGEGNCAIINALKKHSKVDKVLAIWDCPGKGKAKTMDADKVMSKVYICGPKDLKRSAKNKEGYSAIIINPKASQGFVSSLMDKFSKRGDTGQHVLLRDGVTIMTLLASIRRLSSMPRASRTSSSTWCAALALSSTVRRSTGSSGATTQALSITSFPSPIQSQIRGAYTQ